MKVVSVLLGAGAVAGVGSKPTFAKLVHLYFSNTVYAFYGCTCISNDPWSEYLLKFVKSQNKNIFPIFGIHRIQIFLVPECAFEQQNLVTLTDG